MPGDEPIAHPALRSIPATIPEDEAEGRTVGSVATVSMGLVRRRGDDARNPLGDRVLHAAPYSNARLHIVSTPDDSFGNSERGRRITVPRTSLFGRRTMVFAMGSCFARAFRIAVRARAIDPDRA